MLPESSAQCRGSRPLLRRCQWAYLQSHSSFPCFRQDSHCRSSCWAQFWRLDFPSRSLEPFQENKPRPRPGSSSSSSNSRRESRANFFPLPCARCRPAPGHPTPAGLEPTTPAPGTSWAHARRGWLAAPRLRSGGAKVHGAIVGASLHGLVVPVPPPKTQTRPPRARAAPAARTDGRTVGPSGPRGCKRVR